MIWRLLASTLDDRPQRQIMKHEQAMNESKNKTDTLQFARRGQPVHEPRRRACLAFACLVFRPLRLRRSGCYFRFDGPSERS